MQRIGKEGKWRFKKEENNLGIFHGIVCKRYHQMGLSGHDPINHVPDKE